ncbi:MAG: helix-turn-helix domain-containing protein [Acidobacteriia bacterium]|nr:helix-turn-helix domain-containing protein [Terriglobia bacterium]
MNIFEQLLDRKSVLTPQETAEILGKNERTVRNWLNEGLLPGHQIHGRWAIDPGALAVWLESKQN